MLNTIAKVLTLVMLLGVILERMSYATAADAKPFQDDVAFAVSSLPHSFGGWSGVQVPVPEPAQRELRPSASFAREYTERTTGLSGRLVIVHCSDTRDLAGHYPLRCYRSNGWSVLGAPSEISVVVGGTTVPLRRYEFVKRSATSDKHQVVYGTFLIPGRGIVPGMEAVYDSASDYRSRLYGASLLQVVLPDGFPRWEESRVAAELLEQAWPVIRLIQSKQTGSGGP